MATPLTQHQVEIRRNLEAWRGKALLQRVYAGYYRRLTEMIDDAVPGRIVEIGSGIGLLKQHLPAAVATDLFPNAWLDVVCDGYELPFRSASVSHLVLVDVFHHLEAPRAFLREARRTLCPRGKLILLEPYISWWSLPVYGLLHHEPVAWGRPLNPAERSPSPRGYYAAQGNATRLFFWRQEPEWLEGWTIVHAEAVAGFTYLLSGGFSRPAVVPAGWYPVLRRLDVWLSRWPRCFGVRCFVSLQPERNG